MSCVSPTVSSVAACFLASSPSAGGTICHHGCWVDAWPFWVMGSYRGSGLTISFSAAGLSPGRGVPDWLRCCLCLCHRGAPVHVHEERQPYSPPACAVP